mmetsp:Transcript_19402/g.26706  ORF Transcript_19402/g.26706 Transcript_19402/m.26706 type:complete len:93 (+) Transcript_19402:615-893(+)
MTRMVMVMVFFTSTGIFSAAQRRQVLLAQLPATTHQLLKRGIHAIIGRRRTAESFVMVLVFEMVALAVVLVHFLRRGSDNIRLKIFKITGFG